MKKFLTITLISCCALIAKVQAQTKTLTFEEAVKIALRNGVLFNQQKNNLELNQIQKTSNILGIGPTLTAQGQAYRVDGNTFNNNKARNSP